MNDLNSFKNKLLNNKNMKMLKKCLNEINKLEEKHTLYEVISCETIKAPAHKIVETCPIAENAHITRTI